MRRCTIYFYLEDDTIQVNESKQVNSGIPQGEWVGLKSGAETVHTVDVSSQAPSSDDIA